MKRPRCQHIRHRRGDGKWAPVASWRYHRLGDGRARLFCDSCAGQARELARQGWPMGRLEPLDREPPAAGSGVPIRPRAPRPAGLAAAAAQSAEEIAGVLVATGQG